MKGFSGGESGSADTARDPRGFAVKFYTEEGNWDLVGNNTPIFFIRDPILFPNFIHTQVCFPLHWEGEIRAPAPVKSRQCAPLDKSRRAVTFPLAAEILRVRRRGIEPEKGRKGTARSRGIWAMILKRM